MMWPRYLLDCILLICHEQHFGRFKADIEKILKESRKWNRTEVISTHSLFLGILSPYLDPDTVASLLLLRLNHDVSHFSLWMAPSHSFPSSRAREGTRTLQSGRGKFKFRLSLVFTVWPGIYLSSLTLVSNLYNRVPVSTSRIYYRFWQNELLTLPSSFFMPFQHDLVLLALVR